MKLKASCAIKANEIIFFMVPALTSALIYRNNFDDRASWYASLTFLLSFAAFKVCLKIDCSKNNGKITFRMLSKAVTDLRVMCVSDNFFFLHSKHHSAADSWGNRDKAGEWNQRKKNYIFTWKYRYKFENILRLTFFAWGWFKKISYSSKLALS